MLPESLFFFLHVLIFAVLGYRTGTKVVGWVIGGINDKQMPSQMVDNTVKTGGGSIRTYLRFYETRTRCRFVEEGSAGGGPTWNLRPDLSHRQITVASVTGDRFKMQNWVCRFAQNQNENCGSCVVQIWSPFTEDLQVGSDGAGVQPSGASGASGAELVMTTCHPGHLVGSERELEGGSP